MSNGRSWTKAFFIGIWSALNFTRKAFFNVIFIVIAIGIIAAIMKDDGKIVVPKDAALILNLSGNLVIEKVQVDPFEEFMQEALDQPDDNPEVLLQDVLFAIENAKQDRRIKALILNLGGLRSAGLDKLQQIGAALADFKSSEKPIYAVGDYYSQNQYYLASHADHLYLNPMGALLLEGYGTYPLYMKEALAKLKASTHVFRVGTFKSAVEPFIRDDMSEEAKQANLAWTNALWDQYKADVAGARGFDTSNFDETFDEFLAKFEQVDGDYAAYALEHGWVDGLKTREDLRSELSALLGEGNNGQAYANIDYRNYLKVIKPPLPTINNKTDKVGIVVAKGTILNGKQDPGRIGGDSTAQLLRKARLDDSIKAVVLYVDSPGGSAFASEVIRQEVEQLKQAGKPVIAAMSTYAASGGYWISASADKIFAAPSTITGSIGIFGMFMTYENTIDYLGVNSDGVGTTDFAGFSPLRPLAPKMAQIIQRSIENGYSDFIGLVAKERDMSLEQVDQIAQGRVWIGEKALELGLVDELGHLHDAVQAAAQMAELDAYDTQVVERDMSAQEKFWQEFFGLASATVAKPLASHSNSDLVGLMKTVLKRFNGIAQLNDPMGMYAYCIPCEI